MVNLITGVTRKQGTPNFPENKFYIIFISVDVGIYFKFIGSKVKGGILKLVPKEQARQIFRKEDFLPRDTCTLVCVSGCKKYLFLFLCLFLFCFIFVCLGSLCRSETLLLW